jgi:hypothetical protein
MTRSVNAAWKKAGKALRLLEHADWVRLPWAWRLRPERMWVRKVGDDQAYGLTTAEALQALALDRRAGPRQTKGFAACIKIREKSKILPRGEIKERAGR